MKYVFKIGIPVFFLYAIYHTWTWTRVDFAPEMSTGYIFGLFFMGMFCLSLAVSGTLYDTIKNFVVSIKNKRRYKNSKSIARDNIINE